MGGKSRARISEAIGGSGIHSLLSRARFPEEGFGAGAFGQGGHATAPRALVLGHSGVARRPPNDVEAVLDVLEESLAAERTPGHEVHEGLPMLDGGVAAPLRFVELDLVAVPPRDPLEPAFRVPPTELVGEAWPQPCAGLLGVHG
jgi:hypothetical protein